MPQFFNQEKGVKEKYLSHPKKEKIYVFPPSIGDYCSKFLIFGLFGYMTLFLLVFKKETRLLSWYLKI